MINLVDVSITGFRSIDHMVLDISNAGKRVMFRGANGSGKTSILEAIYWGMFGQTLKNTSVKNIPTKEEFRTSSWVGTKVSVLFTKRSTSYSIHRHIAYKGQTQGVKGGDSLLFYKNGEDISGIDKAATQVMINHVLGTSPKLFLQSVLFGQRLARLMSTKDAEKMQILEYYFDTEFIEDLKTTTAHRIVNQEAVIQRYKDEAEQVDSNIGIIEEQLSQARTVVEEWAGMRDSKLADLKIKLKDIAAFIPVDVDLMTELRELKTSVSNKATDKRADIDQMQTEQASLAYKVESLERSLRNKICDACGQRLPNLKQQEDEVANLNPKLHDLKVCIKDAKDEYNGLYNEVVEINRRIDSIERDIIKNEANESLRSWTENQIQILKEESPPSVDIPKLEKDLKTLGDKVPKLREKIEDAEEDLGLHKWWLKAFGNHGIKSYIINAHLEELNTHLKKYADVLGIGVYFQYNLEGKRKTLKIVCTRSDVEFGYDELSGGQEARIDIAISLALHDLLPVKFNVLFLDEFFENLDEQGMADVLDLLRVKSAETKIFIITQYPNFYLEDAQVINFELINNITEIS